MSIKELPLFYAPDVIKRHLTKSEYSVVDKKALEVIHS